MAKEYIYNIGDIIKTKTGSVEILEQIKFNRKSKSTYVNQKGYVVRCMVDGYEFKIIEYHLKQGNGCKLCSNSIRTGINDVATKRPELIRYFVNIKDAYGNGCSSKKKVLLKCQDCGAQKELSINSLCINGFSCNNCSDGISIPNKFIYNLLKQLNIEFETEKSFEWSNNKRYDAFIPSLNCIIEMHGRQHYEESFRGRKIEDEQENDKIKESYAKEHGVDNYIIIDCRYSKIDFIKENIIKSRLLDLLNLKENHIDWDNIWVNCQTNIVKQVAKLWSNDKISVENISKDLGVTSDTIRNWLKKSTECGFCYYSPYEEIKKAGKKSSKKIRCVTNGETYESATIASKIMKTNVSSISLCCSGKYNYAGKLPDGTPLVWEYI